MDIDNMCYRRPSKDSLKWLNSVYSRRMCAIRTLSNSDINPSLSNSIRERNCVVLLGIVLMKLLCVPILVRTCKMKSCAVLFNSIRVVYVTTCGVRDIRVVYVTTCGVRDIRVEYGTTVKQHSLNFFKVPLKYVS